MQPTARTARSAEIALAIVVIVLAFGLVAALLYGIWHLLRKADPTVAAAITGAGATVLVSTLTIVGGRLIERAKLIEAEQRTKWAAIYEDFIRGWLKIMEFDKPRDNRTGNLATKEVAKFVADFSSRAIPWAPERVINQWGTFRRAAMDAGEAGRPPRAVLLEFERLLFTMRKDLGHKDKNLESSQILRMFIYDWDRVTSNESPNAVGRR